MRCAPPVVVHATTGKPAGVKATEGDAPLPLPRPVPLAEPASSCQASPFQSRNSSCPVLMLVYWSHATPTTGEHAWLEVSHLPRLGQSAGAAQPHACPAAAATHAEPAGSPV